MNKVEKVISLFWMFYLAISIVYLLLFKYDFIDTFIPIHYIGMPLSIILEIIILHDIYRRKFPKFSLKIIWIISILLFWPSIFVYLPKYGFKPISRK